MAHLPRRGERAVKKRAARVRCSDYDIVSTSRLSPQRGSADLTTIFCAALIGCSQALAAEISDSRRSSRAGSEADGEPQAKKAKRDETLKSIAWRRVVLDEGHVIKNMATLSAQACRALKAESVEPAIPEHASELIVPVTGVDGS